MVFLPEVIESISLVRTCNACPEQYDAYIDGNVVGYLRLCHGVFTVDIPDASGREIYRAYPRGDGIFEYDEREDFLAAAKDHIAMNILCAS